MILITFYRPSGGLRISRAASFVTRLPSAYNSYALDQQVRAHRRDM